MLPNWGSILKDWPNNCKVEVDELGLRDASTLELFQKVKY